MRFSNLNFTLSITERIENRIEKIERDALNVLRAANKRTTNNDNYDIRYNKEETIGISGTI
ncbi:MAG: hypothetical protein ABJH03_00805 [Maribacter dokdonensis]|uniref:hypothetical protein n=1 Tax=Maribacter dokdonensis TaxID=320912 RepID=UPI003299CC33